MQVKNALNWKIFVFLLCDINQQYQRVLDWIPVRTLIIDPKCEAFDHYSVSAPLQEYRSKNHQFLLPALKQLNLRTE